MLHNTVMLDVCIVQYIYTRRLAYIYMHPQMVKKCAKKREIQTNAHRNLKWRKRQTNKWNSFENLLIKWFKNFVTVYLGFWKLENATSFLISSNLFQFRVSEWARERESERERQKESKKFLNSSMECLTLAKWCISLVGWDWVREEEKRHRTREYAVIDWNDNDIDNDDVVLYVLCVVSCTHTSCFTSSESNVCPMSNVHMKVYTIYFALYQFIFIISRLF